jgi:hypothetical protein
VRFHPWFGERIRLNLRDRDWFGIALELITVVLGVLLGLQASQWAAERQERAYRTQIIAALVATLDDFRVHGREIGLEMDARVTAFEQARAKGLRLSPPIYREPRGERPPTRAWDAIVATGAARSIEPRLFFRLASFFNRADSYGERYIRYNDVSETQVMPYLNTPAHFYAADGTLRPESAAHIDRLRDLAEATTGMAADAGQLQEELKSSLADS